jgi:hypothetical protein
MFADLTPPALPPIHRTDSGSMEGGGKEEGGAGRATSISHIVRIPRRH